MDDKSEVRRELFLRSKPRRNRSPSTVPGVSEAAPPSPGVPSSVAAARLEAPPPPSMEVAVLLVAELLRPSHGRKLSRRVFFPDRSEVDERMRAGPPAAAAAAAVGTSIECRCGRESCTSWACTSDRRGEREATL